MHKNPSLNINCRQSIDDMSKLADGGWHALAKLNIHWTKRQTLGIRETVMQGTIISRPDQSGTKSCASIIVAAGLGVRAACTSKSTARQDSPFGQNNFEPDNFGNDLPKQFWQLGDKLVITHSFDYFHHHPAIAAIILVLAEPYIPHMADILPKTQKPVHLVAGGATRQKSVHAGLTALAGLKNCQNIDYVAIHDAARPLIPADLLNSLIAAIANGTDVKL